MTHLRSVPTDGAADSHQATCWKEFWEVVGHAAYRIWREDQLAATNSADEGFPEAA